MIKAFFNIGVIAYLKVIRNVLFSQTDRTEILQAKLWKYVELEIPHAFYYSAILQRLQK